MVKKHVLLLASVLALFIQLTPARSAVTDGNVILDSLVPIAGLAGAATNIGVGTATLRGVMTNAVAAGAYICWGLLDGGTNSTADWDSVIDMGVVSDGVVFSNVVTTALYGPEYDYRVFVTNEAGSSWSAADTFLTRIPYDKSSNIATTNGTDGVSGTVKSTDGELGTFGGAGLALKNDGSPGANTRKDYLRFDVSSLDWTLTNATLELTVRDVPVDVADDDLEVHVYGLTDESLDGWNPAITTFANAPGNDTGSGYEADLAKADDLGSFFLDYNGDKAASVGTVVSFTSQALVDFINEDSNGLITLILGQTGDMDHLILQFFGDSDVTYGPPNLSVQPTPVSIAVVNTAAANVGEFTANLQGTLDAPNAIFTVTAYWSTNNNTDGTAWMADGSARSTVVGTYTNVTAQDISGPATALDSDTTYYYTLLASNDATNLWAVPNVSFTTLAPPAAGLAGGASNVCIGTVTLRGVMTNSVAAYAYICWGVTDGDTNSTADWDSVIDMGIVNSNVVFSADLTTADYGQAYNYRVFVTNDAGIGWSAVDTFTTLEPTKTWIADAEANWSVAGSWDPAGVPGADDDVLFNSVHVGDAIVDAGFGGSIRSLTVNRYSGFITQNRDLSVAQYFKAYSGIWRYTAGTAADLAVTGGMYLANCTVRCQYTSVTGNGTGRTFTVGGDLTVCTNATINGIGCGFAIDSGPGEPDASHGASHGGTGGYWNHPNAGGGVGPCYGSVMFPVSLGSGGNKSYGGGAVRLDVGGTLTVDGVVDMDGNMTAVDRGGGAGGSVWITADTVAGKGVIRANGSGYVANGAPGGGGRIAVHYTSAMTFPQANLSAASMDCSTLIDGGAGTIYIQKASELGTLIVDNNDVPTSSSVWGKPNTTLGSLVTDVPDGNVLIQRQGDLTLDAGITLTIQGYCTNAAAFTTTTNEPVSTVVLAGSGDTVFGGNMTFGNLTCTTAGKTVKFQAGKTTTVNGALLLKGPTLRSTIEDSEWFLTLGARATQSVKTVDVKDSNASGGQTIVNAGVPVDSGGNTNWEFDMPDGMLLYIR